MPFGLQGSSTLVLQPTYDGRSLPITHQAASEGLALLSIKDPHCDCTIIRDPTSNLPQMSCTQGIKPRNTFWNLHKPELRKIQGLECNTTENVMNLLQTHNTDSGSILSCGKRLVSKLGSIISKKSKSAAEPQVLQQNVSWPINCCVLSSICQETEIISSDIQKKKETEGISSNYDFNGSSTIIMEKEVVKDTFFITHPQPIMHENTSDDLISVSELLNPSNGDSSTNTLHPFNMGGPRLSLGHGGTGTTPAEITSSILLENKQSQHQISIPSNVEFYKLRAAVETCEYPKNNANASITNENKQDENNGINEDSKFNNQENGYSVVADSPSSVAVQSIFSGIFQEIEEMKDVINSYMSSFYVQEEEYNNFPKAHSSSKEVVSHFFDQIHGPQKENNCNPKNVHSTFCGNLQENAGNGCVLEQFHVEKDAKSVASADMIVKEENILQNYIMGSAKHSETETNPSSNYCYWEDNDLGGELMTDPIGRNTENESNPDSNKNSAVVTLEFIENMWEEFINQIETHSLFSDLVKENESKKTDHEINFPSYGHWSNMYDPNIYQEVENIVYTLDNLLINGCFPEDIRDDSAYIPCTIIEIVDDGSLATGLEIGSKESEDQPSNLDGTTKAKQEDQAITLENQSDSTTKLGNSIEINNSSVNEMINRKIIQELKVEPIFYEEKLVRHEIEYLRVPEYERIQLHPLNHLERVNFSPLQSFIYLPTSDVTEDDTEKLTNKIITSKENENKTEQNNKVFLEDCVSGPVMEKSDDFGNLLDNSEIRPLVFEKFQDKNSAENLNPPAFLFSSPAMQLNLTSTFVNTNKK